MPAHPLNAIAWASGGRLRILDQTRLPLEERYLDLSTVEEVAEAIRTLRVRGAPLIGVAAAMGVVVASGQMGRWADGQGKDGRERGKPGAEYQSPRRRAAAPPRPAVSGLEAILAACDTLQATRPTAVNLAWALERMRRRARSAVAAGHDLSEALLQEANAIWEEDIAMCERIGRAGLPLLPPGATVLTHCNAGALATGGMGTALAPIYMAHNSGSAVQVVAGETRPLLQGARLTAWELSRSGIPVTIIADSMASSRLRRGDITCVMVGADRIAANGDVANKIGTYGVALAAHAHGVPFYVAAPSSTFDAATPTGHDIPIEERGEDEMRRFGGSAAQPTVPEATAVWNPAFDVTPAELVTGYITDRGVLGRGELEGLRDED
jgi:methylthioribose-1-phosphate isomerase